MFIGTESTPDPQAMRFLPGVAVLSSGTAEFLDREAAEDSPLARRLFALGGIEAVRMDAEAVTVTLAPDQSWDELRTAVMMAITAHYASGDPAVAGRAQDERIAAKVRELIETRVKPALAQSGGAAIFRGYESGTVYLEMSGRAFAMKDSIGNMLRHYLPEVAEVRDHRDAAPKPGLDTAEGQAIRAVLQDQINPAVAGHGGHIALVDVQGDTAYIRLDGGCQGCGKANVTLRQGVERAILGAVPTIRRVLDVTDHAGGTNPYYEPGTAGASPF